MRPCLFIIISFLSFFLSIGQVSSQNRNKEKELEINAVWFEIEPFIYTEYNQLKGIEFEIIMLFSEYLRKEKGIKNNVKWTQGRSLTTVFDRVKNSAVSDNSIGISSFSITEKRKTDVEFSPPYLTDITVIVTNSNIPIIQNEADFNEVFKTLTPITISGTSFEEAINFLIEKTGISWKLKYILRDELLLNAVSENPNLFCYIDFPLYSSGLNRGLKLQRQQLFALKREGYGFVFPKGSDLRPLFDEFQKNEKTEKEIQDILLRYLGSEVLDLINIYGADNETHSDTEIKLLSKEKEIITKGLASSNLELERQVYIKNIFIIFFTTVSIFLVLVYFLFRKIKLQNKLLTKQNQQITLNKTIINEHLKLLAVKNKQLMKANNHKNDLVKVVAHDLKSPLNQIKGLIHIFKLENKELLPMQMELLSLVDASIERLHKMIGKILDVHAFDTQRIKLNIEEVNLNDLLYEAAQAFEKTANLKGIEIIQEFKHNDLTIETDKGLLFQIIENILSNAIKFSEHDRKVFLKTYEEKDNILFAIVDQGPGLSGQDHRKLFKRYAVLSPKPTGNEVSSGMGLSIVKKYVEEINGKVWCESLLGKGSSFFVSLPKKYKVETGQQQMALDN